LTSSNIEKTEYAIKSAKCRIPMNLFCAEPLCGRKIETDDNLIKTCVLCGKFFHIRCLVAKDDDKPDEDQIKARIKILQKKCLLYYCEDCVNDDSFKVKVKIFQSFLMLEKLRIDHLNDVNESQTVEKNKTCDLIKIADDEDVKNEEKKPNEIQHGKLIESDENDEAMKNTCKKRRRIKRKNRTQASIKEEAVEKKTIDEKLEQQNVEIEQDAKSSAGYQSMDSDAMTNSGDQPIMDVRGNLVINMRPNQFEMIRHFLENQKNSKFREITLNFVN
jgi:hypothetical protein